MKESKGSENMSVYHMRYLSVNFRPLVPSYLSLFILKMLSLIISLK